MTVLVSTMQLAWQNQSQKVRYLENYYTTQFLNSMQYSCRYTEASTSVKCYKRVDMVLDMMIAGLLTAFLFHNRTRTRNKNKSQLD